MNERPRTPLYLQGQGVQVRRLGGQRPEPVHCEQQLELHRLPGPETAIVVEQGDLRFRRYEVIARRIGDARC